MNNPLKAVIVGGGHRSMIYAGLAKTNPEMLKIVGVVDPNEFRRNQIGEYFDIPVSIALRMSVTLLRYRNSPMPP